MNKELSLENNYDKIDECELFLLDMDGTLYLGDDVFDGAVDFIHTLDKMNKKYIYLTNNSSRSGIDYVKRLNKFGFPCNEEQVYTSGMATAEYLKLHFPEKYIYVVGTKPFYKEIKSAGLKAFNSADFDDKSFDNIRDTLEDEGNTPVVCVGFDTELVYRDLDLAVHFLRKNAPFIAANPDWVCPMPKGEVLPDCGSICALLTASTGKKPVYIGKPNRNMVDIISNMTGIDNSKICCVGDRIYTDIAVAQNAGAVSVCVLTGEADEKMIEKMETKPDYTIDEIGDLSVIMERKV